MTNFIDSTSQRPPAEWEAVCEFKEGGLYAKVSRVRNSRRFSLELGGVSQQDGRTMRHIPLRWEAKDGSCYIKEPADLQVVAKLVEQCKEYVLEVLRKEGAHEKTFRAFEGGRGGAPQRKGKTERDRSRRRDRDHDQ